jgi:hypothetical protein
MLIEAALALEIHRTNPALPAGTVRQYAAWVLEEARARDFDPWLFHGVIVIESRWTAGVVRVEGNHTCSVGLGQINVRCDGRHIAPLKEPRANLRRMGAMFDALRHACVTLCDEAGWLRGYNPGDGTYTRRVLAILSRCHVLYSEPALCRVHPHMHVSGLRGEAVDAAGAECGPATR